ncbi:MAG: AraC family transcriptional regulator [Acidobacteriales bacterium]|nr:AraC family transcriptional regulator [Terriglobales bacterium]
MTAFSISRSSTEIGDVAYSCGFADHVHLCRIFKEATGLAPSHFATSLSNIFAPAKSGIPS